MSNIVAKIRQRIALKQNNKFDLSCDHITTADFFQISPVYVKEMVPGEKIKINQATFTRLAPLVNPMLGRCRITNRAFFVPMRTIFKGWNEFITDTPYRSKFLVVPELDPYDIAWVFRNPAMSTDVTPAGGAVPAATSYDFCGKDSSNVYHYFKFTDRGRQAWKIMESLGYRTSLGYFSYNTTNGQNKGERFSALPILAFAKIFKDWYQNQAYPTSIFDDIFSISYLRNAGSEYLTGTELLDILNYCTSATYDKDYFTSAWDRPTAPNAGLQSSNSIPDITYGATGSTQKQPLVLNASTNNTSSSTSAVIKSANVNAPTTVTDASAYNLSQYAIKALYRLTDYLKRHQIAGGLAMDRMLLRFGVRPTDAKLDRSVYIGKQEVNIGISDVMSNASSTTSGGSTLTTKLGEYAGKGIGLDENGWFNYDTDEYGFMVIISVLQPSVGYVQGCSRINLHTDRLDFFTPEFDSLGVQAIARQELLSRYSSKKDVDNLITLTPANALYGNFGYTSRYAEYKVANDNLTGDFNLNTRNIGLDSWHLNRMFNPETVTTADLSHSFTFVQGETSQYDRVFAYNDANGNSNYDHFYVIHHFDIEDYAPMSKLFDDYEYEHDEGNKEVSVEVNGTQLN